MYFIIVGKEYYFIIYLTSEQNLVKTQNSTIYIEIWTQHIDLSYDMHLNWSAEIMSNITAPSGSLAHLNFTNHNNGTYSVNYTFDEIGTYKLRVRAENETIGYAEAQIYIYVGKFPIYIEIVGGTEYKPDEPGIIFVYTEDDDGNPITGGLGNITINYPNGSLYVDNV